MMKTPILNSKNISWAIIFSWSLLWCLVSWWGSNYFYTQFTKVDLQISTREFSKIIREQLSSIETRLLLEIAPLAQTNQFSKNKLLNQLTKEFPEILKLEVRSENGDLINLVKTSDIEFRQRTLSPGLFANFSAASETRKIIYSSPYKAESISNTNDKTPFNHYLIDAFIPTATTSKLMIVATLSPSAWLTDHIKGDSATINKNHYYELLDESYQTIASDPLSEQAEIGFSESITSVDLGNTPIYIRAKQIVSEDSLFKAIRFLCVFLVGAIAVASGLLMQSLMVRRNTLLRLKGLQEKVQSDARAVTLGEMSTAIAHELNQPLGAIENFALGCERLLKRENPSIDEVLIALTQIRQEASRGATVISSIRSFVKRDNESQELINVTQVFDGLTPLLKIQAKTIGCKLNIQCESNIHLFSNRALFEQVLLNLARNGFESMANESPSERVLTIKATSSSAVNHHDVLITFEDNGTGIGAHLEKQLFTPFFTTKPHGMGIGLSLCQSIVERQGGSIKWTNNDDKGAKFILNLPRAILET